MNNTYLDKSQPREPDFPEMEQATSASEPTTAKELADFQPVLQLARMQKAKGIPDADFARVVRFGYSGSVWGKIKAGTFNGRLAKAISDVKRALAYAQVGRVVEADGDTIMFDHIGDAVASVEIAQANARRSDEHRITFVVGPTGSGKTQTLKYLHRRFGGDLLHAHPDWRKSYMSSLTEFAEGLGLSCNFHRVHQLQSAILDDLKSRPRFIGIDEANYFSRDGLDFIKALCNETGCVLALGTLPDDLRYLNAVHNHEARQVIRRSVAIISIPPVDSAMVAAVHLARFSSVTLNGYAPQVASFANKYHHIDAAIRVLDEADPDDPQDLPNAIARVERAIKAEGIK